MKAFLKRKTHAVGGLVSVLASAILVFGAVAFAAEVERIDKDQLKAMLTQQDVVVIDARSGMDWSSSEFKIKGAVRLNPDNLDELAGQYAKGTRLVFYCA